MPTSLPLLRLSAAFLSAILLLGVPNIGPAQMPALSAAQKEKLRERDQIEKQIPDLLAKGKRDEAVVLIEKMMALEKAIFGEVHAEVAGSLEWLGEVQMMRGDWAAARKACDQALGMYDKLFGDKHWRTVNARLARADVDLWEKMSDKDREQLKLADQLDLEAEKLFKTYKYDNAVQKWRQALAARAKVLGTHRVIAKGHVRLAAKMRYYANDREAYEEDKKALEIRRKLLGEEHPETAASNLNVGSDLFSLGDFAQAEKHDRAAYAARRKLFGEEDRDTLIACGHLSSALHEQKKYAEAVKLRRFVYFVRLKLVDGNENITQDALTAFAESWGLWAAPLIDGKPSPLDASFGDQEKRLRAMGTFFWGAEAPKGFTELKSKLLDEADLVYKYAQANETDLSQKVAHQTSQFARNGPTFRPGGSNLHRLVFAIRRDILGDSADTVQSGFLLGRVLYRRGEYEEAQAVAQQLVALSERVHGPKHEMTRRIHRDLTGSLRELGKFTEAEKLDRQALEMELDVSGQFHTATAVAYKDLADDLQLQGRYPEAEVVYRKALVIENERLGENHFETLRTMSRLAIAMREGGKEAEAHAVLMRVRNILDDLLADGKEPRMPLNYALVMRAMHDIGHPEKPQFDYRLFMRTANAIAASNLRRGNFQAAESILNTFASLQRLDLMHPPGDMLMRVEKSNLFNDLAWAQWNLGKTEKALTSQRKAIEVTRADFGENHPLTLRCHMRMARYALLGGDFAEAEDGLKKTLAKMERIFGADHAAVVADSVDWIRAMWAQGKYKEATDAARATTAAFQKARLRFGASGLDRSAFSASQPPMIYLAALLARAGQPTEAWQQFESNLGRGLLDDLSTRSSRPIEERLEEESLLGRIALVEKRLSAVLQEKNPEPDRLAGLRRERNELIIQLGEFQARMEKIHGPAAGQVYSLKTIQSHIRPDAALIGWLDIAGHPKAKDPTGEHWACLVRAKGDPVWVRLKGAHGNWELADDELPGKLAKILRNPKDDATDLLADLYQQRLEPLEPHLKAVGELPAVKHLIVLPSSAMLGFPIEALSDRYLISYAPSGTMHAYLQEHRKDFGKTGDLLALADPAFTEEQFKIAAARDAATIAVRGKEMKRLPGTRGEVDAIAKLIKARGGNVEPLLGLAANGKNLDRLADQHKLQKFRYLHLATHGAPDAQGGMNSFLALASEDFALMSYDRLTAGHILRTWKLDADLVTLSACETALGQLQGGEGYVGFAQALFLAGQKGVGARTVVMSQWQVNDYSTALLMERFYQNLLGQRKDLKEPMGKLAALTEARHYLRSLTRDEALGRLKAIGLDIDPRTQAPVTLTGRRPFAHPFYWAPFVLVGDAGQ